MFIVILDHENIGINTILVTLMIITKKLLKKIRFSIMAALICISKLLPKVVMRTTRLNFFRDPMGSQIHQKTLYFRKFIGQQNFNWTMPWFVFDVVNGFVTFLSCQNFLLSHCPFLSNF